MTYNVISAACQNLSRPFVSRLACLCLAILIVWQLVSGMMSISAINKSTAKSEAVSVVKITTTRSAAASNIGLSTPLFGKYVPVMINVADVKKSMLTYKVVGIMLAAHDEDSEVIIDTLSGGDKVYRVGDILPWGTVIKRITSEGLFVERDGELESLSLPKNELIFEAPAKPL